MTFAQHNFQLNKSQQNTIENMKIGLEMIRQLIDMGFDKEWLQKFLEKSFESQFISKSQTPLLENSKKNE